MTETSKKSSVDPIKRSKTKRKSDQAGHLQDNKVPEGAENIEHTLRRLVIEKERKRSKNFGLYL